MKTAAEIYEDIVCRLEVAKAEQRRVLETIEKLSAYQNETTVQIQILIGMLDDMEKK